MADRIVDETPEEVPELPEILEKVLLFSLEEAKEKLSEAGEFAPFTALVVKDNLFIETAVKDEGETTSEESYAIARHTVEGARGASAYALCYDGYIDTDEGTKDILIAEGGIPGADEGHAVGYLYELGAEGAYVFEPEPAYIGAAPNFMAGLKDAAEYSDEEMEECYLDEDELVEEPVDAE